MAAEWVDRTKPASLRSLLSHAPVPATTWAQHFHAYEKLGVVMSPDDKDAALLPRRINGRWALIHRPMTPLGAHIWISYSPDLRHWGAHKLMLEARRGAWWDANKIGMSPPPIETPRGWLMITTGSEGLRPAQSTVLAWLCLT